MTDEFYNELVDDLRYMVCDRLGPARNKEILQFAIKAIKTQARLNALIAELDADEDAAALAIFKQFYVEAQQ